MPTYMSPFSSLGSMGGVTPDSDEADDSAEPTEPAVLFRDGIGLDIGNDETRKKLDFIEQLYDLGISRKVDLPQLVVVGDQSSGKSSVLQAVTRLPFPVDDKMCTRFATEVSLHRQAGPETITVTIKRSESRTTEELSDLPEAAGLNGSSFDFPARFAALLKVVGERILGDLDDSHNLGKDILQIKVHGPDRINLTIVDIPGLVSVSHEAHQTAKELVQTYIKNPRSIILAVTHPGDRGTQEVFQLLKDIPDKEDRVIGVITKCDKKQEGADDWIINYIRNNQQTGRGTNLHYLKQGWFGLRNRLPTERSLSDEERDFREAGFFANGIWRDLDSTKLGIKNLRLSLTKMHNNHIAKSIPLLVPEIKQQLSDCESKLATLGRPRSTAKQQVDCLVKLATDFSRLSENALDGVYHNLPEVQGVKLRRIVREQLERFKNNLLVDSEKFLPSFEGEALLGSLEDDTWTPAIWSSCVLKKIQKVIEDNRGTELPDEVNPNVLKVLWKGETNSWLFHGNALLEELTSRINETMCILVDAATHEDELRQNTKQWLSSSLHSTLEAAIDELNKLNSDQITIWTSESRYQETISERYDSCVESLTEGLCGLTDDDDNDNDKDNDRIRGGYYMKLKGFLSLNRDLDTALLTYVRLETYCAIALTRFIDNVAIQVVERHLIGSSSPLRMFTPSFVIKMAEDDPELLKSIAGENSEKVAERAGIMKDRDSLKTALATARRYGFSSS